MTRYTAPKMPRVSSTAMRVYLTSVFTSSGRPWLGATFPSIRKWSFMKVRALSEEGPMEHCGGRGEKSWLGKPRHGHQYGRTEMNWETGEVSSLGRRHLRSQAGG